MGSRVLRTASTSLHTIAATGAVEERRTFSGGECYHPTYVTARGQGALWIVCEGDRVKTSVVLVLDPSTLATLATIPVGVFPTHLAFAEAR